MNPVQLFAELTENTRLKIGDKVLRTCYPDERVYLVRGIGVTLRGPLTLDVVVQIAEGQHDHYLDTVRIGDIVAFSPAALEEAKGRAAKQREFMEKEKAEREADGPTLQSITARPVTVNVEATAR